MDNNLEEDNSNNMKPYKATRNLNTIIGNPNMNIDNNLDVNIKNASPLNSNTSDNNNSNQNFDSLFNNKTVTNKTPDSEEKYINQLFDFDKKDDNIKSKSISNNTFVNNNTNENNNTQTNNKVNSNQNLFNVNVKEIQNSNYSNTSENRTTFIEKNNAVNDNINVQTKKYVPTFETSKEKNSKLNLGSEMKTVIIISIVLLLFLIILPMISKIIFGY